MSGSAMDTWSLPGVGKPTMGPYCLCICSKYTLRRFSSFALASSSIAPKKKRWKRTVINKRNHICFESYPGYNIYQILIHPWWYDDNKTSGTGVLTRLARGTTLGGPGSDVEGARITRKAITTRRSSTPPTTRATVNMWLVTLGQLLRTKEVLVSVEFSMMKYQTNGVFLVFCLNKREDHYH